MTCILFWTIEGTHKRMAQFQKLTKNLFLTLHGHNLHRQQRQLSKFLMCYQQFASHAYCGPSFQDGVAAGKGFLCAPHHAWCVFSKPFTKFTLHCNHRSGHLKTEHTENLFLLRSHLGNWPRSKHEKRTAGNTWETWTVAAAGGVCCARVRWEINLLLASETAPLFCVYRVFRKKSFSFQNGVAMVAPDTGLQSTVIGRC